MVKPTINYTCPYCGKGYSNNSWTHDHIIPTALGGAEKFKVISCLLCNGKMSREIEQSAMKAPAIDVNLKNTIMQGNTIKMRRRKKFLDLGGPRDTSLGVKVKLKYDINRKVSMMKFIGKGVNNLEIDSIQEFSMDNKGAKMTEKDRIVLTALNYKILLGTLAWLFGQSAYNYHFFNKARELMWNVSSKKISNCWCKNKYGYMLVLPWKEPKTYFVRYLYLDNPPHHTIFVFENENHLHAYVNLFGEIETSICLGEIAPQTSLLEGFSSFLLIKTDKNEVLKMDHKEYGQYKIQNKSFTEAIKTYDELLAESNSK